MTAPTSAIADHVRRVVGVPRQATVTVDAALLRRVERRLTQAAQDELDVADARALRALLNNNKQG